MFEVVLEDRIGIIFFLKFKNVINSNILRDNGNDKYWLVYFV